MRWNSSFPFSVFLIFILILTENVHSQQTVQLKNKKEIPIQVTLGADLISRYIFRGTDYGNSPAIQPNFSFSVCGFKIGAWGSYGFSSWSRKINDSTIINMGNYAEFDLSISYTFKWFTIGLTDYFFPNPLNPNEANNYFNYKNATTGHAMEGSLSFAGPENFPIQVFVGTFFYGADKCKDSACVYGMGRENNYSTYIEIAYIFKITHAGVDMKPFIGATPFGSSFYGKNAGFINVGFTATKSIRFSDKFSLPVYVTLAANPSSQNVFFVFGLTL